VENRRREWQREEPAVKKMMIDDQRFAVVESSGCVCCTRAD
jgi:hypothetical protein